MIYNNELIKRYLDESLLLEDVDDMYNKYYSNIDRDVFDEILSKGVGYSAERKVAGPYAKWLIKMYQRDPEGWTEYKDRLLDLTTQFNELKRIHEIDVTDINTFKTIEEFATAINQSSQEAPEIREQDVEGSKKFKYLTDPSYYKRHIFYETPNWYIFEVNNWIDSLILGGNSGWCTSVSKCQFDSHTKNGPMYIFRNKQNFITEIIQWSPFEDSKYPPFFGNVRGYTLEQIESGRVTPNDYNSTSNERSTDINTIITRYPELSTAIRKIMGLPDNYNSLIYLSLLYKDYDKVMKIVKADDTFNGFVTNNSTTVNIDLDFLEDKYFYAKAVLPAGVERVNSIINIFKLVLPKSIKMLPPFFDDILTEIIYEGTEEEFDQIKNSRRYKGLLKKTNEYISTNPEITSENVLNYTLKKLPKR